MAARPPLRTHLPEMVVGLMAGLVASVTALVADVVIGAAILGGIGF